MFFVLLGFLGVFLFAYIDEGSIFKSDNMQYNIAPIKDIK